MAVSLDGLSYNQLSSALLDLLQQPTADGLQTTDAPALGGYFNNGYDAGAYGGGYPAGAVSPYGYSLDGPAGYFGAPSNLAGVDYGTGSSLYNGFGAVGTTGLSPSEQQMYNQLAAEDPAAAQKFLLQEKIQKLTELATMISNMSKSRHNTMMSVLTNLK